MFGLIFCIVFCVLELLSIWAGVARLSKNQQHKKKWTLHHLSCTMGIPSVLGTGFAVVCYCLNWPSALAVGVYFGLNLLFLFIGAPLHKLIWQNNDVEKNPNLHHKKKKGKNR